METSLPSLILARELTVCLQSIYAIPVQPDRVMGMLFGHNMGDALGASYEFSRETNFEKDGQLKHKVRFPVRYQADKYFPVGAITDDSAMTWTLLESLVENRGYKSRPTLEKYMKWAVRWKRGLGKNTSHLLKFKKVETYQRKFWETYLDGNLLNNDNVCQSNGSLMRCSPLSVLPDLVPFVEDGYLTNPHEVNLQINIIYGIILQTAIRGYSAAEVMGLVAELFQQHYESTWNKSVLSTFNDAILDSSVGNINRCTAVNRGHVLHPFYLIIYFLYRGASASVEYLDVMISLAYRHGDDTDTNCAIVGSVLGALSGFNQMLLHPVVKYNHDLLITVNLIDGNLSDDKKNPDDRVLNYEKLGSSLLMILSSSQP